MQGSPTPSSLGSNAKGKIITVDQEAGVAPITDFRVITYQDVDALNEATFVDPRWQNAVTHLQCKGLLQSREDALALLLEGAQAFGIWGVSDLVLKRLADQLLELPEDGGVSEGLTRWIKESILSGSSGIAQRSKTVSGELTSKAWRPMRAKAQTRRRRDEFCEHVSFVDQHAMRMIQYSLLCLLTIGCTVYVCYAVLNQEGTLEGFLWPIILARAAGLGTAVITGLLYLTMSRHAIKWLFNLLGNGFWLGTALDGHKELHIFLGKCLYVATVVHIAAHLFSTVPALAHLDLEELNNLVGCAKKEEKRPGWPRFKWLEWPACPLQRGFDQGWEMLLESTPGLSGVVLTLHLILVGLSARSSARARRFDYFWYLHSTIIVLFPIVMFVHGSNQWVGVGFPVIAFTATIPILLYSLDRAMRVIRYYANRNIVKIKAAIVRPGKDGKIKGALTKLIIKKPKWFWSFKSGMYAFINLPEYSTWQWHPFTISSGSNNDYVEFIVASVGDWTEELTRRCLEAKNAGQDLPMIALDGPFAAPSQSALYKSVLVAVGAGVGITPFLSSMAAIIQFFEDRDAGDTKNVLLKEAHFFWITRSMDEFLFGREHITKIANSASLRKRLHLHLHMTGKEPDGDALSFLFRECVKRQSRVDHRAFQERQRTQRQLLIAPELPWCWVNGSKLDVMWLSNLVSSDVQDTGKSATGRRSVNTPSSWADDFKRAGDESPSSGKERLLPVAFGRPDFETELRAIGEQWCSEDINVYVCGNDTIVHGLQDVAAKLNQEACIKAREANTKSQSYKINFEKFG